MEVMERAIEHEVLGYLAEHPNACDTVEGIAEWWLLHHSIQTRTRQVRSALANLVESGLVDERSTDSHPTYYQVNHDRMADIRVLLQDPTTRLP